MTLLNIYQYQIQSKIKEILVLERMVIHKVQIIKTYKIV